MRRGIFISGTGTDIGKTWFSGLLVKKFRERGINAGYYKAALSGAEETNGKLIPGDADFVCRMAGLTVAPERLVSFVYREAVSPALAAELEGNPADLNVIEHDFAELLNQFDYLVVEGSGGIVCPVRRGENPIFLTDVIKRLNLEVLLVADAGLGTINSTILTYEYAKNHGITVCGIVLNRYDENDFLHRDNRQSLEKMTGFPVSVCFSNQPDLPDDFDTAVFL